MSSNLIAPRRFAMSFLVILFGCISIYKNGTITIFELSALLVIPIVGKSKFRNFQLRTFLFVCFFWSLHQFIRDIITNSSFPSAFVAAGPLLIAFVLYSIYLSERNKIAWNKMLGCLTIGGLLLEFSVGYAFQTSNNWKYSYGILVTLSVLILLSNNKANNRFLLIIILILIFIDFQQDSRSLLIATLLCAILILFINRFKIFKIKYSKIINVSLVLTLILVALMPFPLNSTLIQSRNGSIPSANPTLLNETLSARLEAPQLAYLALLNLPFGIGSYGHIEDSQNRSSIEFVDKYIKHLNINEIRYLRNNPQLNLDYTVHSQIGTSVLFGGIFAVPFWVWLLRRSYQSTITIITYGLINKIPCFFLNLMTIWNAFFSPYTTRSYILIGIAIFANLDPEITKKTMERRNGV